MNRQKLPLLLTLLAGAASCVITMLGDYTLVKQLLTIFLVMLLFFILGSIIKGLLDHFEAVNEAEERKRQEEEEAVAAAEAEKVAAEQAANEENQEAEETAP